MNIVECVRSMKEGQIAHSKENNTRVKLVDEYHLYYVGIDNETSFRIDFNANEWCSDDWEIEIDWVDFWTAWQARINEGKKIRCGLWKKGYYGDVLLSESEINAKWQIID